MACGGRGTKEKMEEKMMSADDKSHAGANLSTPVGHQVLNLFTDSQAY